MAKIKPSMRLTETYTESNFLRVYTCDGPGSDRIVTVEHLSYTPGSDGTAGGWRCATIIDGEAMSEADALFIARAYAEHNGIPVIYACHSDPQVA